MKVWKGEEVKVLKEPVIRLVGEHLIVCDGVGCLVAYLFNFRIMESSSSAKRELEDKSYRTSFAEWGEDGAMVRLVEDFDE